MKIPPTLKIGGHTFKVDCSKKLPGDNGETDIGLCVIRICKTLTQSQKEATLIHEMFHAINPTLDNEHLGHALIDSLAEQLYQILSDNKLLK